LDADFRVEKCGHFKAVEEWATRLRNDREDADAVITVDGMPAHLKLKSNAKKMYRVIAAAAAPAV